MEAGSADLTARGLVPGDRVAIMSESKPVWVVALFAVLRSGGVAVLLDSKLTAQELTCQIENAEPRILLASSTRTPVAEELMRRTGRVGEVVVIDDGWPGECWGEGKPSGPAPSGTRTTRPSSLTRPGPLGARRV